MNCHIIKRLDGKFHAVNRAFHGDKEFQDFSTEEEARKWCKDYEIAGAGNKIKKRDVPMLEERLEVVTVIRGAEEKL